MEQLKPGINTGLLIIPPRPEDYQFQGISGITHEDRNTIGNWDQFVPGAERQSGRMLETFACVSFSALNSIETQMQWMISNNLLPEGHLKWLNDKGYMVDGKFNGSDRALAKMSNTTKQGNYFVVVWDTIRKQGIAPESAWPSNIDSFDWDQYYAPVPQSVLDLAKEFTEKFLVQYEWVVQKDIPRALRHAPIQVGVSICSDWHSGNVGKCDLPVGHAVMCYNTDQYYRILDSYSPFKKALAKDFDLRSNIKAVLTPIPGKVSYTFDTDIHYKEQSQAVGALTRVLKNLGIYKGEIKEYYDDSVVSAVFEFQKRYNVASWYEILFVRGRNVGPKTRRKLNQFI